MSVSKDEVNSALMYYRVKQIIADDQRYMQKGEASNYTLPKATSSTLGGVKVGSNIAVNDGTISIPAASASALGVVKIGSNISVSGGTVSIAKSNVINALGYTPADSATVGGAQVTLGSAASTVEGAIWLSF